MLPVIASDEFRLLKITEIDPIVKCHVQVFKLGTAEQKPEPGVAFYALSYTWGDGSRTTSILVNGIALEVTQNLQNALCELYRREKFRQEWHWIDQISINQNDDEEKSKQVRAMYRIYSRAESTLVWLGSGSDKLSMAMDNLRKLSEEMGGPPFPNGEEGKEAIRRRLPPRDHPVWQAIIQMFSLPWWRRVWILQEVVLSKETFVLCGDRTLSWDTVAEFADATAAIWLSVFLVFVPGQPPIKEAARGVLDCSIISEFRKNATTARRLFPLLSTTRDRGTSNPIDRIYGIAAMLPLQEQALINIDYHLSYRDAVQQFCKAYVEGYSSIHLLGMAPSTDRHQGLPSWCPDFCFPSSEPSQFSTYVGFRAGFTQQDQHKGGIRILEGPSYALSVAGFRVDVVKALATNRLSRESSDIREILAGTLAWESECQGLFKRGRPNRADQPDLQEVYVRTLFAGHWGSIISVAPLDQIHRILVAARRYWSDVVHKAPTDFSTYPASKDEIYRLDEALYPNRRRVFFSTESGRVGLGATRIQPGDVVCVFNSGACLWVLRNSKDARKGAFELVGDAYIHEFMDLEVTMRDHVEEIGPREDFIIV